MSKHWMDSDEYIDYGVSRLNAKITELETRLAEVAEIAHNGGCQLSEGDALIAIRRLTLPHWEGATGSADLLTHKPEDPCAFGHE
jgi:hypothetical protein